MAASRSRRNTHASRALALRRATARTETAARRRLGAASARERSVDDAPASGTTAREPVGEPPERLHTVVVKVPADERRRFSDAVRSVLVRGTTPHAAAAAITGGTGARALEARPGTIAPLAVLPGRVATLDERSVPGADVDAERWVFCPRCATRARFRGRTERRPSPGGVWVGDPETVDVVIAACRMCSPGR